MTQVGTQVTNRERGGTVRRSDYGTIRGNAVLCDPTPGTWDQNNLVKNSLLEYVDLHVW